MTSILQAATSAVENEIAFNSNCREMAKNNVSLACNYIKSALTGVFTHPTNGSTTSVALKDRCLNSIKTPLLLVRASLLSVPLINRIIQIGLRLLSPQLTADSVQPCPFTKVELKIRYNSNTLSAAAEKLLKKNIRENNEFNPLTFADKNLLDAYTKLSPPLSIDLINSLEFKEDEVEARYGKEACCKFVEDHFISKIRTKEKINKPDLDLSKEEEAIFISKLSFTRKECDDIFLKVLTQFPEKDLSVNLGKEVNKYKKGKNSL